MGLKPIKSETDYQKALQRLEKIFDTPIGTPESNEADIIGLMVDDYEKKFEEFKDYLQKNKLKNKK